MPLLELVAQIAFIGTFTAAAAMTLVFLVRAMLMSCSTHFSKRRSPYEHLQLSRWPSVCIVIPAHDEERVIGDCLAAMARLDYPEDRLEIVVVNDRSRDRTGEIIDAAAAANPRIQALHRAPDSRPGKPAALQEVCASIDSEVIVLFDADYLPPAGLLKQLVTPFVDPQVGATMGRVVPYNSDANLLTKLIDVERRAGYAIDQRTRSAWNLLPQFGGTVGGIRTAALREVGGWRANRLTEDTDLTYRLFLGGWTVEYVDHALCYEESPENWRTRFRQIRRWAYGHDECMLEYLLPLLRDRRIGPLQKLDASLVLLFYLFPVISFAALVSAVIYPVLYAYPPIPFTVVPALSFAMGFGNFAPYFQMAVGCLRDGQPRAASLVPLLFVASTIGMLASVSAFGLLVRNRLAKRQLAWDKTARFRRAEHG